MIPKISIWILLGFHFLVELYTIGFDINNLKEFTSVVANFNKVDIHNIN